MKRVFTIGCGGLVGVFFLLAVVALVMPDNATDSVEAQPVQNSEASQPEVERVREEPVEAQPAQNSASPQSEVEEVREYVQLQPLFAEFIGMTDLQQEKWNNENQWEHWVSGTCSIEKVDETGIFSGINDMPFEVTCDINGGARAVLYYASESQDFVLGLNQGDVIDFRGRLKSIKDLGFWTSGYVAIVD